MQCRRALASGPRCRRARALRPVPRCPTAAGASCAPSSPPALLPSPSLAGDTGHGEGKLYSVNVPLQEGMDDESYKYVYEPVMQKV